MEVIISALISAASAIIVSLITNSMRHRKNMEELNKKDILQTYRIDLLEKQADMQNQVTNRVFLLEKDRDLTAEKIRVTDHRIENLERIYNK